MVRDDLANCVCKERHKRPKNNNKIMVIKQNFLPLTHLPSLLVQVNMVGWSFMPTTSYNMGPLHGIPNVPCEGGHLVLIIQTSLHLTTLSNPSLGVSNGAQIISPISVQTSNICKVQQVSKKIIVLEI